MEQFSCDYEKNIAMLGRKLRIDHSFDLVRRTVQVGERKAILYFVDGLMKDETLNKIMDLLLESKQEELSQIQTARDFADAFISYGETDVTADVEQFVTFVLSGTVGMVVQGFGQGILIDARTYPARSVAEPENDRVLRGPHDGFVETLICNTAMLRRRLRDPALTVKGVQIGARSKTDVALCYLEGVANKKQVSRMLERLENIEINTLTMNQQSLLECLVPEQRYNPFPCVRFTERPDAAAASVAEGQLILLCDNTPAAMIIPTGFLDFVQDTNDYYFSPVIGTYLRWLRILVSALTLFLTPVWYLLITHPESLPQWLTFIQVKEPIHLPVIVQLLIVEIVIGALKLASLNTPNSLSSSFSVIGALVLGEFAVGAQIMVSEVVLYMAFVAISNFAQPSFELGYALKLSRVMLLLFTAVLGWWGFGIGVGLLVLRIATTKTVSGTCYLYPIIPFNGRALKNLLFRVPISRENS